MAKTNAIYMNGKLLKTVVANGFTASQAIGKNHTGEKVFNMGNGFFLGADPTVSTYAADYVASNLQIADVKLYAGALTAEEVVTAYNNAIAPFVAE